MEELNQYYMSAKTARQRYSELIDELKLPENPQDSDKYDWNLWREYANCLKQYYGNRDYQLNPSESECIEEIICFDILKDKGVTCEPIQSRDMTRKLLEQRIDIRGSVLLPDNYSDIDDRLPLNFVGNDEAERINHEINPESTKSWNFPLIPISNYYDYIHIPSGETSAKSEGVQQSSEQVEGVADGELLRNYHLPIEGYGKLAKSVINEFAQGYKVNRDMIAAMILCQFSLAMGEIRLSARLKSWKESLLS